MKIAYILEVDPFKNSGIIKKVVDQTDFWRENGHQVQVFAVWPRDKNTDRSFIKAKIISSKRIEFLKKSFVKNYLNKILSSKKVCGIVGEFEPDIVYFRQNIWYPGVTRYLKQFKTILELNSVDFIESQHYSWLKRLIYNFGRNRILKHASGLVAVTPDILLHYDHLKIPQVVISNGINLSNFTVKKSADQDKIRLVFVGSSNMKWHGLNRIMELAKMFTSWEFIIVGTDYEAYEEIPDNVSCIGWIDKDKLEKIYIKSSIGIGSFNNHLVGKRTDSTLKVREYLAYGLPVLLGHRDVDVDGSDFILKATNDEDDFLPKEQIANFVQEHQNYVVHPGLIQHIDSKVKERDRLNFFEELKKVQ